MYIISVGQNGEPPPFHTYISANDRLDDMAALLDTSTWEWKSIEGSINNQPLPQSKAIAFIVNDTKIVYGLGTFYTFTISTIFTVKKYFHVCSCYNNSKGNHVGACNMQGKAIKHCKMDYIY